VGKAAAHNFLSLHVAEDSTGVMVETTYRHHGLAAVRVSCGVAPGDFEATVRGVVAMGRFGCNCSLPHEAAVMAFLDDLFAQCCAL
jgi:shikimate 5-dehydrogenase